MNRYEILKNALCALNNERIKARGQLATAYELDNNGLVEFWQGELDETEATYQGLMAMMTQHMLDEAEEKARGGELNPLQEGFE
jgi:hypothetical protein